MPFMLFFYNDLNEELILIALTLKMTKCECHPNEIHVQYLSSRPRPSLGKYFKYTTTSS